MNKRRRGLVLGAEACLGAAWSVSPFAACAAPLPRDRGSLAPMASRHLDRPAGALARLERPWRRTVTRRTLREVAGLREGDLELMGANMMDGTRCHDVPQLARQK